MKFYLESVLKGFKPVNSKIVLEGGLRQTPNFVIVDIDQDGMPEILFAYQSKGEKYIGILKREEMKWYLCNVSLEKNQKAIGLGNLVNILNGVNLTQQDVGKVMTMEDLVGNSNQAFVSYIDDMLNHGVVIPNSQRNEPAQPVMTGEEIIEQEGPLPQPENVNTPEAQAALNQNVITPIMSVSETDQAVNQTPGPSNQQGSNMQQMTTGAQIIQQNGQLPPSEDINTPEAQAALNQNVITPIMSVNETDQAVNQTPAPSNQQGSNMQPVMTGAQIIQQNGQLPPSENINTPEAQAALSQNVITPIMSVNETDQVVNQGAMEPEPLEESEIPEVKVYFVNNGDVMGAGMDTDKEVIRFAEADVTGDGVPDSIYLVANRPRPDIPDYIENAGLRVQTGNRVYEIDFPYGNGYNPVLFVGDITHDGIDDILVNIYAGGDGGFLTSYAYSFANDEPRLLIDSKTFNDFQTGTVIYQDNYRVQIRTLRPPRVFTIDISDRGPEYLGELYNANGTLRRPTEGALLGLITVTPTDVDLNGEYNLSTIQRAIGISNLDTLGLLETYFSWRPAISRFQPFIQYFSILGQPPM